jgi:hypothetical protein
MEESLKCECGNEHFWYFWGYVRCPHCFNEYKQTTKEIEYVNEYSESDGNTSIITENWLRRFNNETKSYDKNWEKVTS